MGAVGQAKYWEDWRSANHGRVGKRKVEETVQKGAGPRRIFGAAQEFMIEKQRALREAVASNGGRMTKQLFGEHAREASASWKSLGDAGQAAHKEKWLRAKELARCCEKGTSRC